MYAARILTLVAAFIRILFCKALFIYSLGKKSTKRRPGDEKAEQAKENQHGKPTVGEIRLQF